MANKLMSTVYLYNWFIKLIGAALLIGLAITFYFAGIEYLVEAFIGIIIAVYAIIRLVPFVKSQKNDLIKTINIIEIVLNLLVAAVMIVGAFVSEEGIGQLFGYLVGGVLLARGMIHFYGLSNGAESGDHITYFFHIAAIIIGTLVLYRGYTAAELIILLIILALLASGYLGFESYSGYSRFRRHKQMESAKEESVSDEASKGIDMPSRREEEDERDQPVA